MIIRIENTNARIVEKKVYRYKRKRRDRAIRRRLALKQITSFIYPDRLKIVSSLLLKEMEKRGYISAQYKVKKLEVPLRLYDVKGGDRNTIKVEVAAIVGRNGEGKSSLIEMMMRVLNNFAYMIGFRNNQETLCYVIT